MKHEEKEKSFDLELEVKQLADKTVPKLSSSSAHVLIPVIDIRQYDAGYLMRLYRRGFVPVRSVLFGQNVG